MKSGEANPTHVYKNVKRFVNMKCCET